MHGQEKIIKNLRFHGLMPISHLLIQCLSVYMPWSDNIPHKTISFSCKEMLSMISEYSVFLSQQEADKLVDHDGECALGYHGSSNQVQLRAVVVQSVHSIKY